MARAGDDSSNPLTATDENQANNTSTFEKFAVPIVFTIFVVFRAADRVFSKAIGNALAEPAWNLAFFNIIWPFAMQFITMAMVSTYVISQRMQGHKEYDCKFFLLGYEKASAKGAIPTYMLALFSLFDQLNAALSSPANAFVSQPIQSVLTNFVLIFTAIIGWFWVGTRFKSVHYIGMALVVVASLVQFTPFIINNDCDVDFPDKAKDLTCFEAYHSSTGGGDGEWVKMGGLQMAFFYLLFMFSTFPSAVGNVYKQKVLQGVGADIFYVTWWSGWFQVLWGWMCIPMMWIPLPGQPVLAPQDTFKALAQTFQCLGGQDPTGHDDTCTSGTPPWVYVILYFSFNATFNLCITWLIKRISATWVQLATVLCLNLCNVFSSLKWIMGPSAQALTAWDWAAAIIMSIALWVYNMQPESSALQLEDEQAK